MIKFQNILVQIDTRAEAHPVLDRAVSLAQSQGAKLKIVDVIPDITWSMRATTKDYQEIHDLLMEKKTAAVATLAAQAREQGVEASAKILSGKSSLQIIAEVKRAHHDLVMRSAKGSRSRRLGFLGTTVTRLMRYCPCAVWSFRPRRSTGTERIVAAVDAHPADDAHARLNQQILEVASGLANGPPDVLHAWSVYGEHLIKDYMKPDDFEALVQDELEQARSRLATLLQPYGLTADSPQVHMQRGSGEEEIARFVNEQRFDVLVIGTVGRSGISGMLVGNTAEMLLDRAECSVLAVKPSGFASPIQHRE